MKPMRKSKHACDSKTAKIFLKTKKNFPKTKTLRCLTSQPLVAAQSSAVANPLSAEMRAEPAVLSSSWAARLPRSPEKQPQPKHLPQPWLPTPWKQPAKPSPSTHPKEQNPSKTKHSVWLPSSAPPTTNSCAAHKPPSRPRWKQPHKNTLRNCAPSPTPSKRWTNRARNSHATARKWKTSTEHSLPSTKPTTSTSKASASKWEPSNKSTSRHDASPCKSKNSTVSMAA